MPCLPDERMKEVFETVVIEALTRIEQKLDDLRRIVAEALRKPVPDVDRRQLEDIPF